MTLNVLLKNLMDELFVDVGYVLNMLDQQEVKKVHHLVVVIYDNDHQGIDHRIQNGIMMMIDEQVDVIENVHQVDHDLVHHHMKNVDHHDDIIDVLDHVQKKKVNVNVVHHQVDHRQQKKKRSRQRSSSRERSPSPAADKARRDRSPGEKDRRDRSSRSPSKDENDDKKEGNKNDTEKSLNEKTDQEENDESHSSPPAVGEAEMKNDDD